MRTLDEIRFGQRTFPEMTREEAEREGRYARRLAAVCDDASPDMMMSRAVQIAKTWRSYLAWRLYLALSASGGLL